jgi:uncharacterized protein YcfJ
MIVMRVKILSLATLFALLVSCAGYRPVIDPASVQDQQRYQADLAECQEIARLNSNTGASAAGGAVVGGAIGAGLGAIISAIFGGNVGEGAAAGAVLGGTQGAIGGAATGEDKYRQIYANCLRGRGYNVLY